MKAFTVVYKRDATGWWVAQVKEAPAALTQGRTIAEARRRIRQALGLALDSDRAARQAALLDDVRLPGGARRALRAVAVSRARLEENRRGVARATEAAIGQLLGG